MYMVQRAIEGISLNGNEFWLDDKGDIRTFTTASLADAAYRKEFALVSTETLEDYGVYVQAWCKDCHDGEHENYMDDVVRVQVLDPDTRKVIKNALLCADHRAMYREDGYIVIGD